MREVAGFSCTSKTRKRNMEVITPVKEVEEEGQAQVDVWQYIFGYVPMAVVKCAIELQIPDVLESHGGAMTLPALSDALDCSPSILSRIMRYLIHRGIFKHKFTSQESQIYYIQTPLSRLLMKNGANSMAALVLLESSPVMLAPWHNLRTRALTSEASAFEAAHGGDVWDYASENPAHSKLINDAMACHAKLAISTIVDRYPEVFKGISSLVDVGGGDGTALRILAKSCSWIRGINFDLPHVVSDAPLRDGVENVGGNMFEMVPMADAALLMWVLHDWSDDECIQILTKCREAIPKDTGKVIIAEAIIKEGEEDKFTNVRLAMDMVMLAHTEKGKERTIKEWEYVIYAAGFTKYTMKHVEGEVVSIIEVYP
ncbi:Hydroxyindole-O-methyltransferase [Handroanthus impetiginosus]|uniref:Hydroxyindole-O-methyltransferase n=1 Tax=Handroanthus impetiginosus TaxID=429701 RepID=A0A2G9GI41_9LAMI|nr:Hydroxyindole-O-methyltransferase [Handroanthus impetiginosus]